MADHGKLIRSPRSASLTWYNIDGSGNAISNLDGAHDSLVIKPKKNTQKRLCETTGCSNKTVATGGICKSCKTARKNSIKAMNTPIPSIEGPDDDLHRRSTSGLTTPGPSVNANEVTRPVGIPSTPITTTQRRNLFSQPSSSATPALPTNGLPTPTSIKTEVLQQYEDGSPTPIETDDSGRMKPATQPVIEISITPTRKRAYNEANLSTSEDDNGHGLSQEHGSTKHRKTSGTFFHATNNEDEAGLTGSTSLQPAPTTAPIQVSIPTTIADEALALRTFRDAIAGIAQSQEEQLAELKRAQQEQLETMEAARIMQTDKTITARNEFITAFEEVQQARDYYKAELGILDSKYTQLTGDFVAMEESRDKWMTKKEEVGEEKAQVEKERDAWIEANEKLKQEKVEAEEHMAEREELAKEEIAKLKEKVEKLKKSKADLVKSITQQAADQDSD
jgi:hypothetical protein